MSAVQDIILSNPPSWVYPGASLDLDFMHARYFQQGYGNSVSSLVSCTRASTGYVNFSNYDWGNVAANTPRISDLGLLVEEQRTNIIRNNSMQGAVVSGANPTNWINAWGNVSGITGVVAGLGTENGIDYIDYQVTGTAGASGFSYLTFDQVTATGSTTYTGSCFFKLIGGSFANISNTRFAIGSNGTGALFTTANIAGITSATLGSQRFSATGTVPSDATFIYEQMRIDFSMGAVINFTVRIGWPQLEAGTFRTSPIRTTNASVTRNADVVILTNVPAFGAQYSLYGAGSNIGIVASNPTTSAPIISVSNGSSLNDRAQLDIVPNTGVLESVIAGSGTQSSWGTRVTANNIIANGASAFATSDQASSVNGQAVQTNAQAQMPTAITKSTIGSRADAGTFYNGTVSRVALWPSTRLPNASLIALTS